MTWRVNVEAWLRCQGLIAARQNQKPNRTTIRCHDSLLLSIAPPMIQKSTVRSDISCLQRIPDTINDSHKKIMKNQICKQIGIWTLIAGTLGTLAVSCAGQAAGTNSSQPHFAGQAPGEKQAILRRIEGTVSAMDSKGMTLTVK